MFFILRSSKNNVASKRRYSFIEALGWIYSIIWLSALIAIWYFWDTHTAYKVIISVFLILGAPAINDLTKSYENYQKEVANRKNMKRETGSM